MVVTVLALHDEARNRPVPTTVYVPESGTSAPLIVFGHGMLGHPRKFTRLFACWADAGYVVAAPAFPHTSDENPPPYLIEDVPNQPRAVVAIAGALFHPDFAADVLRPLPLLLIHGAKDKNSRLRESLKVYEAAQEPKNLVTIAGGGHGICQDDDPRGYSARVAELTTAFWDRHLREEARR